MKMQDVYIENINPLKIQYKVVDSLLQLSQSHTD